MNRQKCRNCAEEKRCAEDTVSWIFFIIGLIATIAIRAVTVLVHVAPVYGQVAWYVGVLGFLIFFLYKFKVEHARSRLIKESALAEKISKGGAMDESDRALLGSVLCAISSNKDRINYLLIFISSAVAIVLAVYFDFIR